MRILAVNPDTMGDAILRQPMFRALQEAGHDLTLVVRPLVTPIARLIAPGAATIEFTAPVYEADFRPENASLDGVVEQAKAAEPDVLLVCAYQWTALEERLAAELGRDGDADEDGSTGVRVVALTGKAFASATWGAAYEGRLRALARVEAEESLPELRKNERLASAVLGRAVSLPAPEIVPDAACLSSGEGELAKLSLRAGEYWAACVGETELTRVRNWGLDRWSSLLGEWSARTGRRFLFVGEKGEGESVQVVERAVRDAGGTAATWLGEDAGALDTLIGLMAHSAGYVGRDTGPMHVAAALGKPVLAVFGGGTWPRFLPSARRSVSVAMRVPCMGCGWNCHLDRSMCIKDVPLEAVRGAAMELEAGEVEGAVTRLLEPGEARLAEIARQSTQVARERLVRLGQATLENKQLRAEQRMEVKEQRSERAGIEASLRSELAAVVAGVERTVRVELSRHDSTLMERAVRAETGLTNANRELDAVKRQLGISSVRQNELQAQVMQLAGERGQHATAAASARDRAIELEARATALEQRLLSREKELQTMRLGGVAVPSPAVVPVATPGDDASLAVKASEAQALAARLQGEKARVEAELSDARLTVQRLRSDLQSLAKLARQREQELAESHERLHNLMSSRWRKLGQRLGVAMVMPWERESSNGKH